MTRRVLTLQDVLDERAFQRFSRRPGARFNRGRISLNVGGGTTPPGASLTVSIDSPPAGSYPEDQTIAIVGTVSRTGAAVTVDHGVTSLGSATVIGTNWSLDWTPSAPAAAANLVAHATEGVDSADSAPVSITITEPQSLADIFLDNPIFYYVNGGSYQAGGDPVGSDVAKVHALNDLYSGGGHVDHDLTAPSLTQQAVYSAAGGPNGTPYVAGNGAGTNIHLQGPVGTTPGSLALFPRWHMCVVRSRATINGEVLSAAGSNTNQAFSWLTATAQWRFQSGGTPMVVNATLNTWGLLIAYCSGTVADYIEWRGTRNTPGVSAGTGGGSSPFTILGNGATAWGKYDVAEWITLNGEPTAGQIADAKAWIASKYGAGIIS